MFLDQVLSLLLFLDAPIAWFRDLSSAVLPTVVERGGIGVKKRFLPTS